MTSTLDSRCPKCGLPLRMNRPSGPSEIVCPKCRHRFGLMPDGKLIPVANLDVFSDLPEPVIATAIPFKPKGVKIQSAPPTPPVEPSPAFHGTSGAAMFQSRVQPRTHRGGLPPWVGKSIVPIVCILITIGVVATMVALRNRLPVERFVSQERIDNLVASLPMADSHVKVIDELIATIQAAETTLDTLSQSNDDSDRKMTDKTIATLQTLQRKVDQLTRRAVAMEPLALNRFTDDADPIAQQLNASGDAARAMQQSVDRINFRAINRLDRAGELNDVANGFVEKVRDFPSTLRLAWRPLARPTSPVDEIEYETLMIKRALWRQLILVEDESDYQALASKLSLAAKELADVAVKYQSLGGADRPFRIYSRYLDAAMPLGSGLSKSMAELQSRYGELDDASAMDRYVNAAESLQ